MTEIAGVANHGGFGMGATWVDYDDDGKLDLFVTNYGGSNRLYHNRGGGTFEEVAAKAGIAGSVWSTGAAWGDFDRDGHIDLYVCNYVQYDEGLAGADFAVDRASGAYSVPVALNPNSFDPAANRLYRNLLGVWDEKEVKQGKAVPFQYFRRNGHGGLSRVDGPLRRGNGRNELSRGVDPSCMR